jgi:hypothetical protein
MFDHGGYLESQYEDLDNGLEPYMNAALGVEAGNVKHFSVKHAGEKLDSFFGGNPAYPDEVYFEERNAMNAADTLSGVSYTLLRNAGAGRLTIADGEGETVFLKELGPAYSAFYHVNNATWMNTSASQTIGFSPADAEEGDRFIATLTYAPEYYTKGEEVDWDALGQGASMSISWAVDNTAPVIDDDKLDVHYNAKSGTFTAIDLDVTDNLWIAGVCLADEEQNLLGSFGSEKDTGAGETVSYTFELPEDVSDHLFIQAYDYANNYVTYKINLDRDDLKGEYKLSLDEESLRVLRGSTARLTAVAEPWGSSEEVTWSSSDDSIASVDENGIVTGVSEGVATITATSVEHPDVSASAEVEVFVIKMTLTGALQDEDGNPQLFTWNVADDLTWTDAGELENGMTAMSHDWLIDDGQYIYQQDWDGYMHQIDAATLETVATSEAATGFGAPVEDFDFAYYYNNYTDNRPYDFTGDGYVLDDDVQALLDYVVLGTELAANAEYADIDYDGDVDTYDVYQMLPYAGYLAPHRAVAVAETYLLYSEDVMENTFARGFPLGEYFEKYTGATQFVAVTWDYGDEDGDEFIALDNAGALWILTFGLDGGLNLGFIETDLLLSYPMMDDVTTGNSLVAGDDGCLYLAHYNGSTSEIYQLAYDEAQELYVSTKIGDVGDNIWPAVLINASSNPDAEPETVDPDGRTACGKSIVPEHETVAALTKDDAVLLGTELTEGVFSAKNSGREYAGIEAIRGIGTDTVNLYANEDTTNGQVKVTFGGAVLAGLEVGADYYAVAESNDGLVLGFVSCDAIPAEKTIAALTFEGNDTSSVRVRFSEVNDVNPYEGEDGDEELNLDLVRTELESATYNANENTEVFVTYGTVPDGCKIEIAGIVAAREADYLKSPDALVYHANNGEDDDPDGFFSRGFKPSGTHGRYTWTKTKVVTDSIDEEGNGWYVRSFLRYTYNNVTRDLYGDLNFVKPGTDYSVLEGVKTELETATYNADKNTEVFVTYGTVPEGCTIEAAGIVAAREAAYLGSPEALVYHANDGEDDDPDGFFSREFKPSGTHGRYTWTKTKVVTDSIDEEGNGWYVRSFLRYTRNGRTMDVYGDLIYVKPGTDYSVLEDIRTELETATYNADKNTEVFVTYGTVPDGCTIEVAGIVAAREAEYLKSPEALVYHANNGENDDPDGFYSRGFKPSGTHGRYTWTKTKVVTDSIDEEGNGWYVRSFLRYEHNGRTVDVYGDLIYVKPGTDYDMNAVPEDSSGTESAGAATTLQTATYNPETKREIFVTYGSVAPEGCVIEMAGIVASSEKAYLESNGELTFENAEYPRAFTPAGDHGRYTWTKTSVEEGDIWYVRSYLKYTFNGKTTELYGDLVKITAGQDHAG